MTDDSKDVRGRIVVGVDGSAHSLMALQWAVDQAVRTGADVDVVGAWQWPASAGGFLPYENFDMSSATRKAVDTAVASVVGDVDKSAVTVRTRVAEGYPAKVLLDAAAGADPGAAVHCTPQAGAGVGCSATCVPSASAARARSARGTARGSRSAGRPTRAAGC